VETAQAVEAIRLADTSSVLASVQNRPLMTILLLG
jgi:hypothetical protein